MEPMVHLVPIGRGEAYLKLAHLALQQNSDGKAVDLVSLAIKNLAEAARLRPKFVCVWKLLGDSCTCLSQLPCSIVRPQVPAILRKGGPEVPSELELQTVGKQELLEIGCRCYAKGVEIQPEAGHMWHDLSLGYFYLANCLDSDSAGQQKALETSIRTGKKAVGLEPSCHGHWNTLGVIAACGKGIDDSALAQHCLIRSIQEEKNNAVAWTNLGALYLKHFNTELAYEAFKKAQSLSPDYAQAWIGHALIAERVGSSEAMDLFRHCTELGYHPEATIGYGYWVCHTLNKVSPRLLMNPGGAGLTEAAHKGVVQARDNLQKLMCREMADACSLNNLGLLWEQEGLFTEAQRAFTRALKSCQNESPNLLSLNCNLTRVQSVLGQDAASSLMTLCQEDNTNATLWLELALALFRQNKFADSSKAYEQAALLSQGSDSSEDSSEGAGKSAVLTAQAMVAFAQGDSATCKTLLFQAFESPPVSLHCLTSLCALACLSSDITLLLATLQELDKLLDWQEEGGYLLHSSCSEALQVMKVLLTSNAEAVPSCGQCVEAIGSILKKLPEGVQPIMPPPTPLSLHTTLTGEDARSQAQKLVHSYPDSIWALALMTSQMEHTTVREGYKSRTLHLVECKLAALPSSVSSSLWHKCQVGSLASLKNWLLNT